MSDDIKGLVGDRRRNPFPSLNDTEYELLMEKIEGAAERGADRAVAKYMRSCEDHQQRTEALEAVVFGRREKGVVGIDQRVDDAEKAAEANDKAISDLVESLVWFRRLIYTGVILALIGIIAAIVQAAIIGK